MRKIYLLLFALLLSLGYANATTYYVDASKLDDTGDGLSWATAKKTIAAAHTVATANSGDEIWIAAGEYTTASITLKNGVKIYGGFAGSETSVSERAKVPGGKPWEFVNVTSVKNTAGNVFTSASTTASSTTTGIDGLTVEGGNNFAGAAISFTANSGGFAVRNTIIQNTNQSYTGTSDHGGLILKGSGCLAEYCLIRNNKGKNGGGAYIERCTIRYSEIKDNRTRTDGTGSAGNATTAGNGGGVFLLTGGVVYNCIISGNTSSYGGGVFMGNDNTSLCYNNIITGNTAKSGSGISYDNRHATGGKVYNNIIANNTATTTGGGGLFVSKNSTVYNSIFYNNKDDNGDVVNIAFDAGATSLTLNNSIVDKQDVAKITYNACVTEAVGTNLFANTTNWAPLATFAGKDTGVASGLTYADNTDITGDAREDGTIDIGPYEIQDKSVTVTVDGSSDVALTSPASAGTESVTFASDYTVTFTTANLPIVTVNGATVIPTTTATNTYSLTIEDIVAPVTTVYLSAAQPKVVTVTNNAPANAITVTETSLPEVGSTGTYNVPEGQPFTLKFTAEGYTPTVTVSTIADYELPAPDASGVYTVTIPAVDANATITLNATLKTLAVAVDFGAGVTAEGSHPATVDYFGNYTVSFKVADGYHLPIVKVNNVYQTLDAPADDVYSFTLTDVREAKNIVIAAYANNVIPVTEDTYVRSGTTNGGNNYANSSVVEIRTYSTADRCRSFLKFDLPAGITFSDYKINLNLTIASLSNGGYSFAVREMPEELKSQFATVTWNNSGLSLDEPPTDAQIVAKTTVTEVEGATLSRDITDYIVAESKGGATAVYLQLSDGGNGFLRFHSREAADYALVPQLVLTPNFVIDATGDNAIKAVADYTSGNYGNIIIKSDETSTGQLINIPEGGLSVNGTVSLIKTFTSKQWYTIGFPFDIASVKGDFGSGETELTAFGKTTGDTSSDDFWLKSIHPTLESEDPSSTNGEFEEAHEFIANQGFIIQVPDNLNGKPITFTSIVNPTLNSTPATLVPYSTHTTGYALTVNPGMSNVTERHAEQFAGHYTHNVTGNVFINAGATTTIALQPFQALLTAHSDVTAEGMRSSIGGGDGTTNIDIPNANDPVVVAKYYNLQGQFIGNDLRVSPQGAYIVKKIHASGIVSVTKHMNK